MKLRIVIGVANFFGALSRLAKRGSGVMVTGRIILKLQPNAVDLLSRKRKVILVSGTNGKTTTTSLVFSALSVNNKVVSNYTGANLFAGLAAALSKNLAAPMAALEVDEMVMPWAIKQTQPEMVILLNLGRDQLDRLSEVRFVAQKWKDALVALPKRCLILADADDPFVVWAALDWSNVLWFSAGGRGHIDASTCPACGAVLQWNRDGSNYSCECGFARPDAQWVLSGNELQGPENQKVSVISGIPGRAALSNAARAIVAASYFGVDLRDSARAISAVASVDGRFATLRIENTNFRLLLSKNPASWRETLATSALGPERVLLVVNAKTQDGKDTSWLWDVDFTPLKERYVVVTGERRLDVSARLTVNEIPHHLVEDETAAAKLLGEVEADLIASYTAFHRLAKLVTK
ncbi:MAG TPA: MurT ligase domain-containing protein [Candidatus Nanopelagicaceae bacterium]